METLNGELISQEDFDKIIELKDKILPLLNGLTPYQIRHCFKDLKKTIVNSPINTKVEMPTI